MTMKQIAAAGVFMAAFGASPVFAADWGEMIEQCAQAAADEGLIDLAQYEPRFDGGSSRRVSVELAPVFDGDTLFVECRMSRGRVVSVELDA
ncbi:MAG: hypothetical protein AAFW81_11245 [Pseudomonadota bacterium]